MAPEIALREVNVFIAASHNTRPRNILSLDSRTRTQHLYIDIIQKLVAVYKGYDKTKV
jgi:hypothetical protein